MRLCFATHNRAKLGELRKLLDGALVGKQAPPLIVLTLDDLGVADDVVEDGLTFAENAEIKARAAYQRTGLWSLADDSGLSVDALGGAPGVHSARYGGEPRSDAKNLDKLLHALREVPAGRRTARFHCALCLHGERGTVLREADCEGTLLDGPRGSGGFGYDPIFMPAHAPPGAAGLTLAELSMEEKNLISHRAQALRAMALVILDVLFQ